jgi:hypothetical protein
MTRELLHPDAWSPQERARPQAMPHPLLSLLQPAKASEVRTVRVNTADRSSPTRQLTAVLVEAGGRALLLRDLVDATGLRRCVISATLAKMMRAGLIEKLPVVDRVARFAHRWAGAATPMRRTVYDQGRRVSGAG